MERQDLQPEPGHGHVERLKANLFEEVGGDRVSGVGGGLKGSQYIILY